MDGQEDDIVPMLAPDAMFATTAKIAVVTFIGAVTMFGAIALSRFGQLRSKRRLTTRAKALAIDPAATSETPGVPAFASKPRGAPPYYGFRILDDVEDDGFTLGMISDWESQPGMQSGDAFIVAPDGSRCGLHWYVSNEPGFEEAWRIDLDRWGVWNAAFSYPMDSHEHARRNLREIVPKLNEIWTDWRALTATWRD